MANIYGDVLVVATIAWNVYRAYKLTSKPALYFEGLTHCVTGSGASSEFLHTAITAVQDQLADHDAFSRIPYLGSARNSKGSSVTAPRV